MHILKFVAVGNYKQSTMCVLIYVDRHVIYHTSELSGHENGFWSKPNKAAPASSLGVTQRLTHVQTYCKFNYETN
jgi:hypothetical protein